MPTWDTSQLGAGSAAPPTRGGAMNLTRTKTIEQSIADTEESEHQLRKELGPVQLTVFGVGVDHRHRDLRAHGRGGR